MPIRGGDPTATQIRGQLASAQAMLASQPNTSALNREDWGNLGLRVLDSERAAIGFLAY